MKIENLIKFINKVFERANKIGKRLIRGKVGLQYRPVLSV